MIAADCSNCTDYRTCRNT